MACNYPLSPGCFSWTPVHIDAGTLASAAENAGATITNFQNLNVFQDDRGGWHAVVAIDVATSPGSPNHWTVLAHASPVSSTSPDTVPLRWTADTVLSGSFGKDVEGNYDGKYYEENNRLYLLYVQNLVPGRKLRNGIVIRPMISPTRLGAQGPTLLLVPGDRFGPLISEFYDHTEAKLVEAPYIITVDGKHALIYSTGAYQHLDYKAGVAWSDALFPRPGGHYRKVLQTDVDGVWGPSGRFEVRYLLQSQKPRWPNFTPGTVWGPGVASVGRSEDGTLNLFFAGYDATDRPVGASVANAHLRRPYFVHLHAAVPPSASVATATDADLASWLVPETR
jgi:hypothetical protein